MRMPVSYTNTAVEFVDVVRTLCNVVDNINEHCILRGHIITVRHILRLGVMTLFIVDHVSNVYGLMNDTEPNRRGGSRAHRYIVEPYFWDNMVDTSGTMQRIT